MKFSNYIEFKDLVSLNFNEKCFEVVFDSIVEAHPLFKKQRVVAKPEYYFQIYATTQSSIHRKVIDHKEFHFDIEAVYQVSSRLRAVKESMKPNLQITRCVFSDVISGSLGRVLKTTVYFDDSSFLAIRALKDRT